MVFERPAGFCFHPVNFPHHKFRTNGELLYAMWRFGVRPPSCIIHHQQLNTLMQEEGNKTLKHGQHKALQGLYKASSGIMKHEPLALQV